MGNWCSDSAFSDTYYQAFEIYDPLIPTAQNTFRQNGHCNP